MRATLAIVSIVCLSFIAIAPSRGNEIDDSRRRRLDIERRMRSLQVQLRDWESRADDHKEQAVRKEQYLSLKERDRAYFEVVVADVEADIKEVEKLRDEHARVQSENEDLLRRRARALALCAASLPGASASRPSRRAATTMVGSWCSQVGEKVSRAQQESAACERMLLSLQEKHSRYSDFARNARQKDSDVRADIERSLASAKQLETLRKEGAVKLKALEAEDHRLASLMTKLSEQFAREAEAKVVAQAPPRVEREPAIDDDPKAGAKQVDSTPPKPPIAAVTPEPDAPPPPPPSSPFASASGSRIIPAVPGTPVKAVEAGVVAFANAFEGWGNLVVIFHDGDRATVYGYLSQLTVRPEVNVYRGQELGYVGPLKDTAGHGVRFQILGNVSKGGYTVVEPDKWKPTAGDLSKIILGPAPK